MVLEVLFAIKSILDKVTNFSQPFLIERTKQRVEVSPDKAKSNF